MDDLTLMADNAAKFNTETSEITINARFLVSRMIRMLKEDHNTISGLEEAIVRKYFSSTSR